MKAVIVANGKKPDTALLKKHMGDADFVIAVDGGMGALRQHGLKADLLIGDFDSAKMEDLRYAKQQQIPMVKLQREKDDTDTQAALDEALSRGADLIIILGAIGSRFDHSYSDALLLVRALRKGAKAYIMDKKNTLFVSDGEASWKGKKGGYVSILPLTEGTAASHSFGLKYPLQDLALPLNRPVGTSNKMTQDTAGVTITSGLALIALTSD